MSVLAPALLVAACEESPPANVDLPPCDWARVVSVTDGDTVRVRIDGREERVRYIGIDAPETGASGGEKEPFADEATARNEELVGGEQVCLERDESDTDRFDRLLRYAWLADGRMVNEVLVAEGLAEVVVFRPDVKYHENRLYPAQDDAKAAGAGIWR